MKKEITALAKSLKISEIGFCSADFYLEREKTLEKPKAFADSDTAEAVLSGIKSVIVCAFSYFSGDAEGNISLYARGMDYHIVATEKMQKIVDYLNEKGYTGKAYADTGALNERLLAQLSGLAFIGKNHMAINEKLGSYFFIGYILTDCELSADVENTSGCMGCGKCVSACPLGALSGDGFCEERCLSYITQKKGELLEEEIDALAAENTIWGCDICQKVCPHNKEIPVTDIEEFQKNVINYLEIDNTISNKEFKRIYEGRAFTWRGKGVLLRNQNAIYNRKKNRPK